MTLLQKERNEALEALNTTKTDLNQQLQAAKERVKAAETARDQANEKMQAAENQLDEAK